jgi:hypothetical protein
MSLSCQPGGSELLEFKALALAGLGLGEAVGRGLGEAVGGGLGVVMGLAARVETGLARATWEGVKAPIRRGKNSKVKIKQVIFLKVALLELAKSGRGPRDSIRPSNFL